MRRGAGAGELVGYENGQERDAEEGRAGLGLGLLCRLHLRKEHSSISFWSIKESSFVGETLGGDLVGLGYGQGRGAEEDRAGVGVGIGVGKMARARVNAMSGVVQGLGFSVECVCAS